MSVVVSQQPEDYTPGYNPQVFVALSNQIASDNFVYTVVVTDLITSESIQYQIAADPNDNRCYFDALPFVENYLEHYLPINEYGWKRVEDGIRKIRVNIGETYGDPAAYFPGSNIDYIVWNAVEDYLEHPNFDIDNYKYSVASERIWLTTLDTETTYRDRSHYIYALTAASGDFHQLQVEAFDSSAVSISTSVIENPWYASTTYNEKYICIDVGPKGLENIAASGVTSGTWPIDLSNAAYYVLTDRREIISPPSISIYNSKRINIGCEREFTVYTIHYWAKKGCFQTIHFNKRSDTTLRRQNTTYQVDPYTRSGGSMTYSRSSPTQKQLGSSRTETLRLCTDWMTETEIERHKDILDSAYIYLDTEELDYPILTLLTDSYELFKDVNEPLFQLTMDFEYSHRNHRQR